MLQAGHSYTKAVLVLVLLAAFTAAQIELSGTTEDSDVKLILPTDKEVIFGSKIIIENPIVDEETLKTTYDTDSMYLTLEENTQTCYPTCTATYIFKNTLDTPISLESFNVEFYNTDGTKSQNIKEYVIKDLGSPTATTEDVDIIYIKPGQDRRFKVTATKTLNEAVEWIPKTTLTKEQIPSLTADTITLRQVDWALWNKGGYGITTSSFRAWYKLDETSGTTAFDSSGNVFNGVIGGATLNQIGVFNHSFSFDGINDFVNLSNNIVDDNTLTGLTYLGWFKANGFQADGNGILDMRGDINSWMFIQDFDDPTYPLQLECALNNATGSSFRVRSGFNITANMWYFGACVWNQTHWTMYINATQTGSIPYFGAKVGPEVATSDNMIGANYNLAGNFHNGTIDNVQIYNRSLSQSEITVLWESSITELNITSPANNTLFDIPLPPYQVNTTAIIGLVDPTYVSINYTNASGSVLVLMDNAVETNVSNVFLTKLNSTHYQVKDTTPLNIGYYNVSLLACSGNAIKTCDTEKIFFNVTTTPTVTITFDKQTPADIDVFSQFGVLLNVSYNITVNTGNLISNTSYSGVNVTGGCWATVNGSCFYNRNITNNYVMTYRTGDTFTYDFADNQIYPAHYILNETLVEKTVHSNTTVSNSVSGVKCLIQNISTVKEYGAYEMMSIGETAGTSQLTVYYCNSSYTTGVVTSNPNCAAFGSINTTQPYNHTHTTVSKHMLIPFAVSPTGLVNGVRATSNSYFVLLPTIGTGSFRLSYTPYIATESTCQSTGSGGAAWSNFAGTYDMHLHQYDGSEAFTYFVQACGDTAPCVNTTQRFDLLELRGLPPTQPSFLLPTILQNYSVNIGGDNIYTNFTVSVSPNGYTIQQYNLTLYNNTLGFVKNLVGNLYPLQYYSWNPTGTPPGDYVFGVWARDSQGQNSTTGYSNIFTLYNSPTSTCSLNQTIVETGYSVVVTGTVTPGTYSLRNFWIDVDGTPETPQAAASGANTYVLDTTGIPVGGKVINCYFNDSLDTTNVSTAGTLTIYEPVDVTNFIANETKIIQNTVVKFSMDISGTLLDRSYIYYNPTISDQAAVAGTNNHTITMSQTPDTYTLYGCANNTLGVSFCAPQTVTMEIVANINETNTPEFNTLVSGSPLKAIRDQFTTVFGDLIYPIVAAILYIGLWMRTNLEFSTICLDIAWVVWGTYFPAEVMIYVYTANALMVGKMFYRLLSPIHSE